MAELYQRLRKYQEEAKLQETIEIEEFKKAIQKGEYSKKCLSCFVAGFRWCRWWKKGGCEEYEKAETKKEAEELARKGI